jgi:hypothetical protein
MKGRGIDCESADLFICQLSKYDSELYSQMVSLLIEIARKWNIRIIDLWNEPSFNSVSQEDYNKYMHDPIHPTLLGYKEWWAPYIEKCIFEMI